MSEAPVNLVCPAGEAIDAKIVIGTDVVKPVIVLIAWEKYLHVLLAANYGRPRNVPMLLDVRSVRIPIGWRLSLLRWLSRFKAVYLPDEFLYERVVLLSKNDEFHCVIVSGEGLVLACREGAMFPVKHLTLNQYQRLLSEPGRAMLLDVAEIFRTDLVTLAPKLTARFNPLPPGAAPSAA